MIRGSPCRGEGYQSLLAQGFSSYYGAKDQAKATNSNLDGNG